jgi:predicted amidohydrolase
MDLEAALAGAEYKSRLDVIKQHSEKVWKKETFQHTYYTLHGMDHSRAVISVLDKLVDGIDADSGLTKQEIFYLLASVYLHDVGMLISYPEDEDRVKAISTQKKKSFTKEELIRDEHHLRSGKYVIEHASDLNLDHVDSECVKLICEGHRVVKLNTEDYNDKLVGNERIRVRLLSALLRFSDELDVSYQRTPKELMDVLKEYMPDYSRLQWLKHYYTSGVGISVQQSNGMKKTIVEIQTQHPNRERGRKITEELIFKPIEKSLNGVDRILLECGLNIKLNPPEIRFNENLDKIPKDIYDKYIDTSDKIREWHDLIRLTQDRDEYVRRRAVDVLGPAFPYLPDKNQAWHDLIRLTQDRDEYVRRHAVDALGQAFPYIPDKNQAWQDMHWLIHGDEYVRASANHTLGRASISKAIETENEKDFRKEIKNAVDFFDRSSKEATYFTRSRFCLPFYKAFYAVIFEGAEAEDEVKKCLAEAKNASEGSGSEETLLEAVENLASALAEARKARKMELDATKSDLIECRGYCERAEDLIGDAEEGAPGAAGILRRGLPIIGERIREIQEKAEALCRETRGTPLEELGREAVISAQRLPIQNPSTLMMDLSNMASIARDFCNYLPADKRTHACTSLENLTGMEILEQGAVIARVFEYVQENIHTLKIQTVHISETEQEIVRIAVAQFCFELTESFPFIIKKKDEVKTKIFSALEIARNDGANIVCLPELCLCKEWISEIGEKYPDTIVIGGSFYENNKNICPVIIGPDIDVPYQPKITPSPFEHGIMEPRMAAGDRIYRYETKFGKFVILICSDFDDLAHFFRRTDIDMIFCPSFNPANERFQNEAHSHIERTPSYILIANTGLYGGTSIFGRLNRNYFGALVDGGCKERGDPTYKLCEATKESVPQGCSSTNTIRPERRDKKR